MRVSTKDFLIEHAPPMIAIAIAVGCLAFILAMNTPTAEPSPIEGTYKVSNYHDLDGPDYIWTFNAGELKTYIDLTSTPSVETKYIYEHPWLYVMDVNYLVQVEPSGIQLHYVSGDSYSRDCYFLQPLND